jgi:OPA family glycerol-3-phosphate transporter-like MFS transporter
MGVISLSYLFGDAAARKFMSVMLAAGLGWRGVFFAAAATPGVLPVLNLLLLREPPERLAEGEKHRPESPGTLLRTFGRSRVFWLVCMLSCGLTILRETFNLWTPTYFTQWVGPLRSRWA